MEPWVQISVGAILFQHYYTLTNSFNFSVKEQKFYLAFISILIVDIMLFYVTCEESQQCKKKHCFLHFYLSEISNTTEMP